MARPPIAWNGTDTEIQMTGLSRDHGVFDDPDRFYATMGTNLNGVRGLLFRHRVRHRMNRIVARIRRRR